MVSDKDFICVTTHDGKAFFDGLWDRLGNGLSPKVESEMDEQGLEVIGEGDERAAFIDQNGDFIQQAHACVVKVNKHHRVSANETEFKNYKKAGGYLEDHLLPITDHADDYKWLVTPYTEGEVSAEQLFELERALVKDGWRYDGVRQGSVSVSKGRPILMDYSSEFKELDTERMGEDERLARKRWKWGLE